MGTREDRKQQRIQELLEGPGRRDPLAAALLNYCKGGYSPDRERAVNDALLAAAGKTPAQWESVEDFLSEPLLKTLKDLLGEDFVRDLRDLTDLTLRGQFSTSWNRRSYRSRSFCLYRDALLYKFFAWMCFSLSGDRLAQALTERREASSVGDLTALAINRGDRVIIHLLREMILGDNNVLLSRQAILGIVKSDSREMKELLIQLLKAAGRQEGLRQSILESADAGDPETLGLFLQVCLEEDLLRFSSAARAFFTWTGLYHEKPDPSLAKRLAQTAYVCLTEEARRLEYLESENPLEVYLALWALGCREVEDTEREAERLLEDPRKYRRLLGWYFVRNVEDNAYRHRLALRHLEEPEPEVLAYLTKALSVTHLRTGPYVNPATRSMPGKPEPNPLYPADPAARRALFRRIRRIVEFIGNKTWSFNPSLFPWNAEELSNESSHALRALFSLAVYDLDPELTEELWSLRGWFCVEDRRLFYAVFPQPDRYPAQRAWLYEGLKDRSPEVKETVLGRLKGLETSREDLLQVRELLKGKSASVRKAAADYLKNLAPAHKLAAIPLLAEGSEGAVQAALELMLEDKALADRTTDTLAAIRASNPSPQTQILLDRLRPRDREEIPGPEQGYGLFDRQAVREAVDQMEAPETFWTEKEILARFPAEEKVLALMEALNQVFEAHKDYEYEFLDYAGTRNKVIFGTMQSLQIPAEFGCEHVLAQNDALRFEMIPFHAEFRAILAPWLEDPETFALLLYLTVDPYLFNTREVEPWFRPFNERYLNLISNQLREKYGERLRPLESVIQRSLQLADRRALFRVYCRVYFSLCHVLGPENLSRLCLQRGYDPPVAFRCGVLSNLRSLIRRTYGDNRDFSEWFRRSCRLERQLGPEVQGKMSLGEYARALDLGLIPADCFYERVLAEPDDNRYRSCMWQLTNRKSPIRQAYPGLEPLVDRLVETMVRFEAVRGQGETPLTGKAMGIRRIQGAELFCLLLSALGAENFHRGYIFERTKNAVLSSLLKVCVPGPADTAQSLKDLVERRGISEKRLVEAAMYVPAWAALVEALVGWPGLKKAVWFFQAHISEQFSSEKETEVAIYSPISPQQFNDGAFDVDWFRDCYGQLGEKRFRQLYQCAKYITEGSNAHKRSQLYTDAVTGKLDPAALEKEILEKRNQERLRAYGLIPVDLNDEGELLRRYEFIAAYEKGARAYGAQRRESERKAARVALDNLALSAGIRDVNRLRWQLERVKLRTILPLTEKRRVGDWDLWLSFDEAGDCQLQLEKEGKPLKSVPKALAKDPLLEEMKQTVKELKDQRARTRRTLEEAMENRTLFLPRELGTMLDSVTVAPFTRALVWRREDGTSGFPNVIDGHLILKAPAGTEIPVEPEEKLYLAHPHDLKQEGTWLDYMHHACQARLVQPFKQIFRELYPITSEELQERTCSRRYAGYQVQPQQAVALLRTRGWTVDYEEGLQKVSYLDNIVVRLYAAADWFSPADAEAPTLEQVEFHSRRDWKPLALDSVDPVLFSEIMRDLDLAVSVAHVGGVDPETSHSTLEMRAALARELTAMMKLTNVRFTDHHALIAGKLAEYSVHLGSGVVHAAGKGMIPILPVHAQHRGRIFLPFADEDPKTAEILSKILLLAEDRKIKDPTILDCLG